MSILETVRTISRLNARTLHTIPVSKTTYMPKFPKGFGRRKSTANAFEDVQESPVAEHSFKVFERPDGGSKSFDGGVKLAKTTPVGRPKTSHKEDNMFEDLITSNR